MGTPQMGHQSKMAIDVSSPSSASTGHVITDFDSGSKEFEYLSEALTMSQTRFRSDGIRGSRSKREERCRITQEAIGGTISMHPTQVELDTLLPLILGADEASSDVFNVAETMQEFGVLIDRGVKRFSYAGCVVNSATFSASSGGPMSLSLDILGKKESTSDTTFASRSIGAADTGSPFIMSDVTFSLPADASATDLASFSITINNELMDGRYMNSLTRTDIPSGGRSVTLSMTVPYTADEAALYDTALKVNDDAHITLTSPAGPNIKFEFAAVEFAANSPTVSGKNGEYMLTLSGPAYATSSKNEIKVTNAAS